MIGGRRGELEGLTHFWRRVRDGQGGSLALVGDAGMGKTALLAMTAAHATVDGACVIEVDGARGEESLAWGGAARIVQQVTPWPVGLDRAARTTISRIAEIPSEGGALSSSDATNIAVALLSLLRTASREQPILLCIDDLQWLDPESADLVRFLTRRVTSVPIGVLIAARDLGDLDLPNVVALSPLGHDESLQLLSTASDEPISMNVARRIAIEAAGNPALLRSTLNCLSDAQRQGLDPLPCLFDGDVEVDPLLRDRIRLLAAPTRRALAALAMVDSATVRLEEVLAVADCGLHDLAAAEHDQLLEMWHGSVRLASVLARMAAYWSLPAPDRRRLHDRWAEMIGDDHQRLLHRSHATLGSDAHLAQQLDGSAEAFDATADHARALELRLHARSLLVDPDLQRQVALRAAESAMATGDITAARSLVATTDIAAEPARRLAVLAALADADGDLDTAASMWAGAISAESDPRRAARSLIDLCLAHVRHGRLDAIPTLLDELSAGLDPLDDVQHIELDILRGIADVATGDIDADTIDRVARYRELLALGDDELVHHLPFVANAVAMGLAHFRQHDAARAVADRCERIATEHSISLVGPAVATARCLVAVRSDLPGAAMYGTLAVELAERLRHRSLALVAEGYLMSAEAHLGQAGALEHIDRLADDVDPDRRLAAGIAASGYWLTMGQPERALEVALAHGTAPGSTLVVESRRLADLGEAAACCHRLDLARSAIASMRSVQSRSPDDWLVGAIERVEGMIADADSYETHFAASVAAFERSMNTLAIARTELLWGERLRRARRRGAARAHLERARRLFSEVGAGRWAERAETELVAAGSTVDSGDRTRDAERVLTARELHVARLAVGGASYREIAAQLFLSPRTIETHLSSVYRKIGVRNRAELSARAAVDAALRPLM